MKKIIIAVVLVVATVAIFATVAYILFLRPSSETEVVYAATEVGTPNGPAVTKSIGPAGGSLASPDGRLTLTVPQNDLTDTVAFTIQPITNKARNGLGLAYRLEPNGKTFTTPLEISVRYDEKDLEGTIPEALSLAYQDKQGAWHAQKSAKLDQSAKTLTVATTHFTDFASLAGLRMSPLEATLHVGESQFIQLLQCKEPGFWDKLWSRPVDCSASPPGKVSWKVYGPGTIKNMLSRRQTVAGVTATGLLYTAPAKKPTDNIVYVDLTIDFEMMKPTTGEIYKEQRTFRTKITIIDRGYRASGSEGPGPTTYSGTVCSLDKEFTVIGHNGPLDLTFKFTPSGDGRAGTGTLGGSVSIATWTGGGSYTIEGFDSEKPKIVFVTHQTVSGKISGSGTFHIDLVPLDTDECK